MVRPESIPITWRISDRTGGPAGTRPLPPAFGFSSSSGSRTARSGPPWKIRSGVDTTMRRPWNPVSRRPMKLTGLLLGALLLTLAVGWLGAALPALAPARGDDDPARPRNGYPPGTGSPQHRSGAHPEPRRGVASSGPAVKSVRTTS